MDTAENVARQQARPYRHAFPRRRSGCALLVASYSGRQVERDPSRPMLSRFVSVDNRGFLDMTIYVVDGTRRVRLGVANGNGVTRFTIPSHLVPGGAPIRFLCDPIGGNHAPVSDEIFVKPGDQVTLHISENWTPRGNARARRTPA